MKIIRFDKSIPTAGHYTPGVVTKGELLFISGQVPVEPKTGKIVKGDLEIQFKQVLKNIKDLLDVAGADIEDIVKVNILVAGDGDNWYKINQIYREFMGKHKPARTIMPVLPLHNDYLIEVEAIVEINSAE